MSSTPTRVGAGLNLTPKAQINSRSSFFPTSPLKSLPSDYSLTLTKVIGTTTTSNSAFDCIVAANCFGFTAGAVVVVATVDNEHCISQRVFRANPATTSLTPATPLFDSLSPFGASQTPRNRGATSRHREGTNRNSYFGSPTIESLDSPNNRRTAIRERVKTTTCLSFSRDGRLLAVGEAGHRPRVLLFSLASDAPTDYPLNALLEHDFGVRCVAFSPDSQYLATLGDVNNGFLHIWRVNTRTGTAILHASNKCTSNIEQIAWLGTSLITVGTRHVKIWRIEVAQDASNQRNSESGSVTSCDGLKTLLGRNCLLGPLLDQTFTAVASISADKAIVCSDQGDICVLHDTDASPLFVKIAEAGFKVNAVAVDFSGSVLLAGRGGQTQSFVLDTILRLPLTLETPLAICGTPMRIDEASGSIKAMAFLGHYLVTLDSGKGLQLINTKSPRNMADLSRSTYHLPAHGAAVLGVQALTASGEQDAAFLTWSAEGRVMFWNPDGSFNKALDVSLGHVLDSAESANELRIVRSWHNNQYLITGDRRGVVRLVRIDDNALVYEGRGHMGEVTDIASWASNDVGLVASSGKDRMVQVYCWKGGQLEILQTLDEHTGSVAGVIFTTNARQLLSFSSDRTIVVRECVIVDASVSAFVKTRTIVMKSTPTSIVPHGNNTLLISTNDRQVLTYDLVSGTQLNGFKTADSEGGDSVVMGTIAAINPNRAQPLFIGISNSDKSLRIYDEAGRLIARDYGHTEGITGIAVVENGSIRGRKSLVTVAADGTIFLWNFHLGVEQLPDMLESLDASDEKTKSYPTFAAKAPLRRVLSSSELARLQELRGSHDAGHSSSGGTPERSVPLKRPSKLSTSQTPKGKMSGASRMERVTQAQTPATPEGRHRRGLSSDLTRPSSPRGQSTALRARQQSVPAVPTSRPRGKSLSTMGSTSELNALILATEQVCRSLHSYRKKLSTSGDVLPVEYARELERELGSTAKAMAEKSARSETAMVKLLDEYSERLVGLLDEKIEASVARQVAQKMARSSASEDGKE